LKLYSNKISNIRLIALLVWQTT